MTTRNSGSAAAATPERSSSGDGDSGFELFLSKLSARDRGNVEKHLAACEAASENARATLWRRLASGLMTLAGHSAKLSSRSSVQFYQADGKYRMQVFALEDAGDGELSVYCTDVLERAIAAELVTPLGDGADSAHYRAGDSDTMLSIARLNGSSADPAPLYKDMLGWNRKAIRITLPTSAGPNQLSAVEAVCALSVATAK